MADPRSYCAIVQKQKPQELYRASGRSREKKVKFSGICRVKFEGKNGRFRGKFAGFSRPVSLKNDW